MGAGHPECPERLDAIDDHFHATGLRDSLDRREADPASLADIELAHGRMHVAALRGLTDQLVEDMNAGGPTHTQLDPDTSMNAYTWRAALRASGDPSVVVRLHSHDPLAAPPPTFTIAGAITVAASFDLASTRLAIAAALQAVRDAGLPERDALTEEQSERIGVMVGGQLFTQRPELAGLVGADATAPDGRTASLHARQLVSLLLAQA